MKSDVIIRRRNMILHSKDIEWKPNTVRINNAGV